MIYRLLVPIWLAWICHAYAYSNSSSPLDTGVHLGKRQTDPNGIAAKFPSAVLLQDGKQMFCPIVMISNEAGVMAASCVDREKGQDGGSVEFSISVGLSGSELVGTFEVEDIAFHDDYDPDTFANNIAIVTFKPYSGVHNYAIAMSPHGYTEFTFVHRTLTANNDGWNDYYARAGGTADENECSQASTLFKENPNGFMCNKGSVPSMWNKDCVLPYKYVIGDAEDSSGQLAIYSHSSAPDGDQFCGGGELFSYYLIIANYAEWINGYIDTPITAPQKEVNGGPAATGDYSMTIPDTMSENGYTTYSLYEAGELRIGGGGGSKNNGGDKSSSTSSAKGGDPNDNQHGGGNNNDNEPETVTVTKTKSTTETETVTESCKNVNQNVVVARSVAVRGMAQTTARTTPDITGHIGISAASQVAEIVTLTTTVTETTTDIRMSECPVQVPCMESNETIEVTITETETKTERVTDIEAGMHVPDHAPAVSSNPAIKVPGKLAQQQTRLADVITVTVLEPGQTATETVTIQPSEYSAKATATGMATESKDQYGSSCAVSSAKIAGMIIELLLLLAFGYYYYQQRKKRQHEEHSQLAASVAQFAYDHGNTQSLLNSSDSHVVQTSKQ